MYPRRTGLYLQHSTAFLICLFLLFMFLMNALTWRYGNFGLDNEE